MDVPSRAEPAQIGPWPSRSLLLWAHLAHAQGAAVAAVSPLPDAARRFAPPPSSCRRREGSVTNVSCDVTPPTSAAESNRHHQPINEQSWRRAPLLHAAVAEFSLSSSSATALRHRLSPPIKGRRAEPLKLSLSSYTTHRPISLTGALPAKPSRHDSIFPLPLSLHFETSRHRHLLLSAGLSSCYRRSGHLSLSLRLPPLSPGARCSGTPSPTGVPTSRPPESRHLARPPLSFLSAARQKKRRRDRTASSISIQGADVDPDGYAEAAGNLKAQGKT
uniref:Uncharacterized protein n=1 Tax=Oryza meridionalis TaxID=40149 RepID=A0A0E0E009_9ORYZ